MSNKGLNSNEALDESTATNSSVRLSGARRAKEIPHFLAIKDYRRDCRNSDRGRRLPSVAPLDTSKLLTSYPGQGPCRLRLSNGRRCKGDDVATSRPSDSGILKL